VDEEEQIDMNQEITEDEFGEEVNEIDVVAQDVDDDEEEEEEGEEKEDAAAVEVDGAGSSGGSSPADRRASANSPKLNLKMNKLDLGGVQETPRDAHGAASGSAASGTGGQETARDNVGDTGSLTTPRGEHTMFDTVSDA
jgi:hypothetical protein